MAMEIKSYFKQNEKSLFAPSSRGFRGNIRTPSIAHWKAHGGLPIRHFSLFLAVETL